MRFPRAALVSSLMAGLLNGSIPAGAETVNVTLVADGLEIGVASIQLKIQDKQ